MRLALRLLVNNEHNSLSFVSVNVIKYLMVVPLWFRYSHSSIDGMTLYATLQVWQLVNEIFHLMWYSHTADWTTILLIHPLFAHSCLIGNAVGLYRVSVGEWILQKLDISVDEFSSLVDYIFVFICFEWRWLWFYQ